MRLGVRLRRGSAWGRGVPGDGRSPTSCPFARVRTSSSLLFGIIFGRRLESLKMQEKPRTMLERVLDLFVPKPGKAAGEACAPFVPFFCPLVSHAVHCVRLRPSFLIWLGISRYVKRASGEALSLCRSEGCGFESRRPWSHADAAIGGRLLPTAARFCLG